MLSGQENSLAEAIQLLRELATLEAAKRRLLQDLGLPRTARRLAAGEAAGACSSRRWRTLLFLRRSRSDIRQVLAHAHLR